jgi:hypothetical protein
MKTILNIFLIMILLAITSVIKAQESIKPECDCVNENFQLPDGVKYLKAQKDASEIKLSEKRELKTIPDGDVILLNLSKGATDGTCIFKNDELDNFQKGGYWTFLPNEFIEVYKTKKDEFGSIGNSKRLERLLGLPPNYGAKCFVVINIASSKAVRPSITPKNNESSNYFYKKWDGSSVFTSLGYTCDWYYGNGCEYGLTEFNIPPAPPKLDKKYLEVKSSCTIDEYIANGKCLKEYPQ